MKKFLTLILFCNVLLGAPLLHAYALKEIVVAFSDPESDYRKKTDHSGITLDENVPEPKGLVELLTPYLGASASSALFDKMRCEIVDYYKKEGYPLVAVEVSGKVGRARSVTFDLYVARLGDVCTEGANWFSDKKMASMVRTKDGEMIRTSPLVSDLEWMNQNPFRQVEMIFEKGKHRGETDITLAIEDQLPLRVYAGYENNGYLIAGDSRWVTGVTWGNAFMLDHELTYEFMTASSLNRWWGNTVQYIAPLSWRHIFKVFGSFVKTEPNLSDPNVDTTTDQSGKGWTLGARYIIPLPRIINYGHNVTVGYDFKRTNNFFSFAIAQTTDNYFDIDQFLLGYDGKLEGPWGITAYGLMFYISPGGITSFNKDRSFEREDGSARANYFYIRGTSDSIFKMPLDFSWVISSLFQWSSGALLPTEQMSLGGYNSVRGYDEHEVVADRGILIKNEFRLPPFSVLPKKRTVVDRLQFLAFLDFATGFHINPNIGVTRNHILASIGPGIRYSIDDYLIFRFDYGWQLDSISGRIFGSGDHHRLHTAITVGF